MQCERLINMIKSWYIHVREETMAPARMVGFIEEHAESCDVCLGDPDLKEEIAKITELILPESKIPKAVRQQNLKDKEAEEQAQAEQNNSNDEGVEESEKEPDEATDDEAVEQDLETDDPQTPPKDSE